MTFTFKPRAGGRIRADIATAADGPHVWLSVTNTRAEHAAVFIPLDRLEEVIAGLREIARQQDKRAVAPQAVTLDFPLVDEEGFTGPVRRSVRPGRPGV